MSIYDTEFYKYTKRVGKIRTKIILPMLEEVFKPKSVVDVGCGIGLWAKYFLEKGCDVLGIDGEYVDKEIVEIPLESFHSMDLENERIVLPKRYDLCISIEVAEHLSGDRAESFIEDLCNLSDNILFSAAIKGQPGVGHVNCQYQDYWECIFNTKGYYAVDLIRDYLWYNEELLNNNSALIIQNLIFYSNDKKRFDNERKQKPITAIVHPKIHEDQLTKLQNSLHKISLIEQEKENLLKDNNNLIDDRENINNRLDVVENELIMLKKCLEKVRGNWWYKFGFLQKERKMKILFLILLKKAKIIKYHQDLTI